MLFPGRLTSRSTSSYALFLYRKALGNEKTEVTQENYKMSFFRFVETEVAFFRRVDLLVNLLLRSLSLQKGTR